MTAKNKMDKYHEKQHAILPESSSPIHHAGYYPLPFSIFSTHLPDFIPNQGGAFKFPNGKQPPSFPPPAWQCALPNHTRLHPPLRGRTLHHPLRTTSTAPCSERLTVWGTIPCSPVVFFLNTPAVIRQLNQPFDGIRHHIRKQDALSIQMRRGPPSAPGMSHCAKPPPCPHPECTPGKPPANPNLP